MATSQTTPDPRRRPRGDRGGIRPDGGPLPAEIARYLDGLTLVGPGLVSCSQWRPDGNDTTPCSEYAAVAAKAG